MLDKTDLEEIGKLINPLQKNISQIQNDLKVVKKDLSETRSDVKVLIAYFDREYVDLRKRIEIIEEHLGLTQTH